jgi:hypothetical protein
MKGSLYIDNATIGYSLIAISLLLIIEIRREYFQHSPLPVKSHHWIVEHLSYVTLAVLIIVLGVFDGGQFIYFQF